MQNCAHNLLPRMDVCYQGIPNEQTKWAVHSVYPWSVIWITHFIFIDVSDLKATYSHKHKNKSKKKNKQTLATSMKQLNMKKKNTTQSLDNAME